jgi:hypothetical protein
MTRLLPHPPIDVELDGAGHPVAMVFLARREPVTACNHWRVEESWWGRPVVRDYYKLVGQRLLALVYRDALSGT